MVIAIIYDHLIIQIHDIIIRQVYDGSGLSSSYLTSVLVYKAEEMAASTFSPLWEQLSIETSAIGYAPAR